MSSLLTAIPSCLCFAICWSTETVTAGSKSHISSLREPRGKGAIPTVCIAFVFVLFFFVLFCFLVFRLSNGNLETRNIRWAALSPKLKKKKKANRIAFPGKVHCLFLNSVLFLFNQVSSCVYPSVPTTRIQGLKFFVYCICNIMWHPLLNSWRFHSEKVWIGFSIELANLVNMFKTKI